MSFISNFGFLERHDPVLYELAHRAERNFTEDPNTCIVKLRQFVERLVKHLAGTHRVPRAEDEPMSGWARRLALAGALDDGARVLVLEVWHAGSTAVHDVVGDHRLAADLLRKCRKLAIWYEGRFGDPDLKPSKFELPPKPTEISEALAKALADQDRLEQELEASRAAREQYERELAARLRELERPVVVLDRSLGEALGALSEGARAAVSAHVKAFRKDPELFDLEPFDDAVDPKFRWVALPTEDLALVVGRSPQGDFLVAAWVGGIEAAHEWVRTRRIEVHPELGLLQIFDTPREPAPKTPARLFATHADAALTRCGVPPTLLPSVRAVDDDAGLEQLARYLPEEAATALRVLARGGSLTDAQGAAGLYIPAAAVDVGDFGAALGHAVSRRTFVGQDDDQAFQRILDAPIEQWRVFLHPTQRKVVAVRAKGPVRVVGGAGTGKTVALLHRVVHLLRHGVAPEDRVLVTTYTRNLARDLLVNLAKLLEPHELRRVEVTHLHSLASDIVRSARGPFRVVSDGDKPGLWRRARSLADPRARFSEAFVQDEWEQVVQAQGITSKQGYWTAPRRGRGTALSRADRTHLWGVFSTYRELLDVQRVIEWADLVRQALELVEQNRGPRFRAALVDEVQDLTTLELRLLRALVPEGPDDLFLVGDSHQRIYALGTSLSACGIQVRGRSYHLKVNYRTTEAIRRFAVAILAGATFEDDEADDLHGYTSLRPGTPPRVVVLPTQAEELTAVVEQVKAWLQEVAPEDVCVAARAGFLLDPYVRALRAAGVATVTVEANAAEELGPGVRTATMHRLKGTEFKRVLLCAVHDGAVPLPQATDKAVDDASREDALMQERCLLYVAATRARDELAVFGHGRMSSLCPSSGR